MPYHISIPQGAGVRGALRGPRALTPVGARQNNGINTFLITIVMIVIVILIVMIIEIVMDKLIIVIILVMQICRALRGPRALTHVLVLLSFSTACVSTIHSNSSYRVFETCGYLFVSGEILKCRLSK